MKKHITRKQIGRIYAAMKNGEFAYNKDVINYLYNEVADHDFDLENEEEYKIFRTVDTVLYSLCSVDGGCLTYPKCEKVLAELV